MFETLPVAAGLVLALATALALAAGLGEPRSPGLALPLAGEEPAPRPGLARLLAFLPPPRPRRAAVEPAAAPPETDAVEAAEEAVLLVVRPPPAALLAPVPEEAGEGRPLDGLPLVPPLEPVLVASPFGPRPSPFTGLPSRHEGVDLAAAPGSRVRAAAAGRVRRAGPEGPFGLLVELEHEGGLVTRYAHLARILVRPGEPVAAGRPVGLVGSSGRSTGPHLHYEVRIAGVAIDPVPLLEAGRLLALARAATPEGELDDGAVQAYGPIGLGGEAEPPT